jgi:hypothetical protein
MMIKFNNQIALKPNTIETVTLKLETLLQLSHTNDIFGRIDLHPKMKKSGVTLLTTEFPIKLVTIVGQMNIIVFSFCLLNSTTNQIICMSNNDIGNLEIYQRLSFKNEDEDENIDFKNKKKEDKSKNIIDDEDDDEDIIDNCSDTEINMQNINYIDDNLCPYCNSKKSPNSQLCHKCLYNY